MSNEYMTLDEYRDSTIPPMERGKGAQLDAGWVNRMIEFLRDECPHIEEGEDGETRYPYKDLVWADKQVREYLAS